MTKASRRSLARPQEGPPEGEEVDTTEERRMRHSLARSSMVLAPDSRRSLAENVLRRMSGAPAGTESPQPPCNPEVFFNCLKLAAENKINVKNAFSLSMIDYLSFAVKNTSQNNPLANFQLAGCSLDAGTKIYAARVDHVAASMAEFIMSMSMMNKKGAKEGDGGETDGDGMDGFDDGEVQKKKKKKGKARATMLVRDPSELTLDMSKTIPKNKMFGIVGNLMDEAVDAHSFSFSNRSRMGAVKDMDWRHLERAETEPQQVLAEIPQVPDSCSLCPSLAKFRFSSEGALDMTGILSRVQSRRATRNATDSPRLTLTAQNLDPRILDEAAALPFDDDDHFADDTFTGGNTTVIEGGVEHTVAQRGRMPAALLADDENFEFSCRMPDFRPSQLFSFQVSDKDLKGLTGPHHWKYKKPNFKSTVPTGERTQRKVQDDGPMNYESEIDISRLQKKKVKTYLARDTLIRWNPDRYILPLEEFDDFMLGFEVDTRPSILDVGLVRVLKIPAPDPTSNQTRPLAPGEKIPYDYDNQVDKQDYCPYPDQPMMPSDDEDDDNPEDFAPDPDDVSDGEALTNLFQLFNDSAVALSSQDDPHNVFSESHLLPEPANLVATVAPKWTTMRGINMKHLESLMWKHIDSPELTEAEKLKKRWNFTELRKALPPKNTKSASVTTTLYALLNLANRKGLELKGNSNFSDFKVRRLGLNDNKPRTSRVHPALLSNDS